MSRFVPLASGAGVTKRHAPFRSRANAHHAASTLNGMRHSPTEHPRDHFWYHPAEVDSDKPHDGPVVVDTLSEGDMPSTEMI